MSHSQYLHLQVFIPLNFSSSSERVELIGIHWDCMLWISTPKPIILKWRGKNVCDLRSHQIYPSNAISLFFSCVFIKEKRYGCHSGYFQTMAWVYIMETAKHFLLLAFLCINFKARWNDRWAFSHRAFISYRKKTKKWLNEIKGLFDTNVHLIIIEKNVEGKNIPFELALESELLFLFIDVVEGTDNEDGLKTDECW